jgi:tetrahydromethanopterin S-methyltransferase subunit G
MRQNASLAAAKSGAFSVFASALGLVKAPLAATAEPRKEEDPIVDLRAKLDQANNRLDRIERETGARLDKLGERMDETSAAKSAEPAASTSGATTDVAARLERLEKSVISAPVSDLGDVTARLDKLEKKIAGDAAAGAKLAETTARLDKLEKRVSAQTAAQAATGAAPLPPSRAGSAQSQALSDPAAARRVLQNYAVEDVQDGVAVVASRYGAQQVAPGDFLPGAGRVLRIERRGGDWYVVTSNGVIAGAPSQY